MCEISGGWRKGLRHKSRFSAQPGGRRPGSGSRITVASGCLPLPRF
ncbi:hypothetical protein LA76x_1708 [Lysobacter antibioticus]|uniref:Uncharacterized protein n=1 Tax=Lysobacter antibioticus TaxID=84531 RepID=A0A0S2F8H6_LYSAN|nr:hypothetical protein LA76x_1708 [Lysobacter antibioticus]